MKVLFTAIVAVSLLFEVFGARIGLLQNKEFICPPEVGFYPADDQCGSDYFYCIDGNSHPLSCPCNNDGNCTVFDPAADACVDPGLASCSPGGGTGGTTLPLTSTAGTGEAGTTGSSPLPESGTTFESGIVESTTSATPAPSLPPFTCTADGFFPVPGTCGPDFYVCAGTILGYGRCPEGALFDPVTLRCTPAEQTSCNVPFTCPESEGFFPYPGACSSVYYICVNGQGFLQYCPGSTTFDPAVSACVQEPSCTPGSYSTTSSTEPTTTSEGTTPTTPFTCPGDGNFPIPGECRKYYICSGGMSFVVTCPGDMVFNADTANCDYIENVPECATSPTTLLFKNF